MPRLKQTLFVARSEESAHIYLDNHTGAIRAVTLTSLLSEISPVNDRLDPFVAQLLLAKVIRELDLTHFDYLSQAPESIRTMESFFRSVRLNRVDFEDFGYPDLKLQEIKKIFEAYEQRKRELGLADGADRVIAAMEALEGNELFDPYESIVIDRFEEEGIRFTASEVEEGALEILKKMDRATLLEYPEKPPKTPATFNELPTYSQEARFALKAARRLMEEGVKDTDIAIVASQLSSYRRVLESLAGEYGIHLHFSAGTPLAASPIFERYLRRKKGDFDAFAKPFAEWVTELYEKGTLDEEGLDDLKRAYMTIRGLHFGVLEWLEKAKNLGLEPPSFNEAVRTLAKERYIPSSRERAGIMVTELSQVTLRGFKHLIFIGTDLTQFPPRREGDFLCSIRQREALLHADNSYRLSAYFYRQMLRNSENVHLATAQFREKRNLSLPPIVDVSGCRPFDVGKIEGEGDLLMSGCRFRLDDNGEAYIDSMLEVGEGAFDGAVDRRTFDPGTLSATTLSGYARCPLRYLFTYLYECEPIETERDEEALEASDIGTIFHAVAERFANAVKRGDILLPETLDESVKEAIEKIAKEVFDAYMKEHFIEKGRPITLIHRLAYNDLLKGLYEAHHQKGLLIRFLEYIYSDEGSLEHFYESERYFMLDRNYEITTDKNRAHVKGFIDRIDMDDEEKSVRVIDYKTGTYKKEKAQKLEKGMASYREFQLPLYLLYAQRAFSDFCLEAFLVSFRAGDGVRSYGHIGTSGEGLVFDEAYEEGLKEAIDAIHDAIERGRFAMTPSEENCEYCGFERICHRSVLPHKEVRDEV